ncbi:DUF4262 domain-containing protein [Kitasatospora indigofera]|uniref:DUF4262 domain-containing protein n=1 Tax=Kitasatospora indigofera TaxID=67307 RepID=UPI0033BB8E12
MSKPMDDFITQYTARIRNMISQHGYAIQAVFGDRVHSPYSYTVGLHHQYGYELVVAGLAPPVAGQIIKTLVDRFAESAGPDPDIPLAEVVGGGYRMSMRRVHSLEPFAMLRAVYGPQARATYWQALWPDRFGNLPTDPACTLTPGTQSLL